MNKKTERELASTSLGVKTFIKNYKFSGNMKAFLMVIYTVFLATGFVSCVEKKQERKVNKAQKHNDPVCGMDASASGVTSFLEGKTYYFCNESCKERFDAKSQDFLKKSEIGLYTNLRQNKDYGDSVNMGIIKEDTLKGSPRRHACFKQGSLQIDID
jgi:YHS domain-containing protein